MEKLVLSVPAIFGDHHTTAVREILEALKGISHIYVSAASRQVVLEYDPKAVDQAAIEGALAEHGYLSGEQEPARAMEAASEPTRHSAAMEAAGAAMTFKEPPPRWQRRPLWPCPGLEYRSAEEEPA